MQVERLPDRSLVFAVGWAEFRRLWLEAELKDRVVLDTGRPAVLTGTDPLDGRRSYHAPHASIWAIVRAQQRHRAQAPGVVVVHPKRGRLCQQCGAEMEMVREHEHTWAFACPACKSSEVYGKDRLGGTEGAGEAEKR